MDRPAMLSIVRFLGLACICFLVSAAQAQITNVTGDQAPPIPGAGHDYIQMLDETVNPATGAVSIRIAVPSPPGRGISVPFAFGYDSNAAHHFSAPASFAPADNPGYLSKGGWSYLVPQLNLLQKDNYWFTQSPVQRYDCYYFTDYMFTDLGGGSHALGISTAQPPTAYNCTGIGSPPITGVTPFDYLTGGSDGFTAITNVPSPTSNVPAVTVVDADGTVYSFSNINHAVPGVSGWSGLPDWIEDRNGNKVTFVDHGNGSFSVTDTLGRTALSSSGFGTTGNAVSVSGLSSPYTVTWGSSGSNWSYSGQTTHDPDDNITSCGSGNGTYSVTLSEITGIQQPNRKSYQFQYDATSGLMSKVIYPTGGYVRYVWGANPLADYMSFFDADHYLACHWKHDAQAVTDRYVSFDGTTEVLHQHFAYATPTWVPDGIFQTGQKWTQKTTTVTTYDLQRGTNFNTVYTYSPVGPQYQRNDPVNYDTIPVENTISYYDTSGSLLRTVAKTFVGGFTVPPDETVTLVDTNQVSQTTYAWAGPSLALLKDKYDYDYGSGAPGALLKQTHIDYASFTPTSIFPSSASIADRPSDIITYDGSGNRLAETDYLYDQTSVAPVSAIGHDDTNYPSGSGIVRGNATTKTVKCLQSCPDAITEFAYDQTGQVTSLIDPCVNGCSDMTGTNHTTSYSYADSYTILSGGANNPYTPSGNTNAYLTQITDPLGHTENFTYDYNTGQLTVSNDQNRQTTSYIYNDSLARPTQSNYPDGGQTEHAYNDSAPSPSITTCQLINGTAGATCSPTSPAAGWKTGVTAMDGLGHVVQTQLVSDPDGVTYTATTYDGLGRPRTVTNPYRSTGDSTYGITTQVYDALGRTCVVVPPDFAGSAPASCPATAPAGDTFTAFSGNLTTVTDEAGNQRKSQTDGLGRLTAIWEAPNTTGYNYQTDYQYDALGNLLCAVQKGTDTTAFSTCAAASANWRPRSFAYDSLSRLTSATNPESGTITYAYDLNSNLVTRVTPRAGQTGTGQMTHNYTYDVLNRLLTETHENAAGGTDEYAYDGTLLNTGCGRNPPTITSAFAIGRRSAMCGQRSGTAWSFDKMGRTALESTLNYGSAVTTLSVGYTYNKDGSLNTLTYPSGDVVTYTVGGAGRATKAIDSTNNFVTSATYVPPGLLAGMTNGTGIVTSNIYNDRLQPILLSAGVGQNAIFSLCYDFHLHVAIPSCNLPAYTTGNNGNVFQVLNNVDSTRSAVFAYDSLNRISQANTTNTTSSNPNCWGEVYSIDSWGNLYGRAGVPGMAGNCLTEGLSATASTNNQLNGIGVLYDAAGNVTNDGNGNTLTYDQENRISTDAGFTYYYDADGTRIEKISGSSGTMYWMGPSGALTETDLTGAINEEYIFFNGQRIARVDRPSGTVHYYFSDMLGSTSAIASTLGAVQEQCFYYPYGGQQSCTGSDLNHYKFTGKERDSESGLDMFGARYYGSSMGRFMTPDWAAKPVTVPYANFGDPQSLNLYAYVRNNPLNRIDPNGHCDSGGQKQSFWWCVGHALGFNETQEETAARISNERQWLVNNVAQNKGQADYLRNASAATVNGIYQKWDQAISKAASGEIIYGAKDFVRDANGNLVLYRGGPSFEPRPGEYKLNPDGTVKTTRGVSVNTDPAEVERFGGAYEIKMLPPELTANPWGRAGHYELVPAEEGFTMEQVLQFLRSIVTEPPAE